MARCYADAFHFAFLMIHHAITATLIDYAALITLLLAMLIAIDSADCCYAMLIFASLLLRCLLSRYYTPYFRHTLSPTLRHTLLIFYADTPLMFFVIFTHYDTLRFAMLFITITRRCPCRFSFRFSCHIAVAAFDAMPAAADTLAMLITLTFHTMLSLRHADFRAMLMIR